MYFLALDFMPVHSPIFVVASAGSGAAVLFEMLERARETVRLIGKHRLQLQSCLDDAEVGASEQTRTLRAIFRDAAKGTRRAVVTSLARHKLSIAKAHATWPNARFIYVYRYANEHIAVAPGGDSGAKSWEAFTQASLQALAALPASAWCAVNYADLLAEPEAEVRWLGAFLGLTWSTGCLTGGPVLKRHRAARPLSRARTSEKAVAQGNIAQLAQRAETLMRRHHPAWVAQDVANAQQRSPSRRALQRFQRVLVSGRVAAGICLATALPQAARATTYQVTSLGSDPNTAGTLPYAIHQANSGAGGDTITFSSVTGTLVVPSGLRITKSVTIQGPGSASLAIDGNNASCVFYPYSNANLIDVAISGLTIQNGNNAHDGGAIQSHNANLSLEDCVVQNSNSGGRGGGIFVGSVSTNPNVSLIGTTVTGNRSAYSGGGVAVAQGNITVTVTGSTLSGNTSARYGGGLYAKSVVPPR